MSTKAGRQTQAEREDHFRRSMNETLTRLLDTVSVEAETSDATAKQLVDAHAVLLNTSMNAQLAAKQAAELALSAAVAQRDTAQAKLELAQSSVAEQELQTAAAAAAATAAASKRAQADSEAAEARAQADKAAAEAAALQLQLSIVQAQHETVQTSAAAAADTLAAERLAAATATQAAATAQLALQGKHAELEIAQHRATAAVANATALQSAASAADLQLRLAASSETSAAEAEAAAKARAAAAAADERAAEARTVAAHAELDAVKAQAAERLAAREDIAAQLRVATQAAVVAAEERATAQAKADEAHAVAEARSTELHIERARLATETARATEAQRAEAAADAARQLDTEAATARAAAAAEAEAAVVLQRERALLVEREASSQRLEQERRKTELDVEAARSGTAVDVARAKAQIEADAAIKAERENEDVKKRLQEAAAEAERVRLLAAVNEVFARLADGATALVTDYAVHTCAGGLALFVAFFGARELMRVVAEEVKRQLGMPSLVRETSMRMGLAGMVAAVTQPMKDVLVAALCPSRADAFGAIVLPGQLEADVRSAARSIANAKRNHAPLRHMMFHGPPGTGKTMAAQLLARHCGLDYAIMSGGDVAPLGAQAVEELHKLFAWAKGSKRGLLLFIDEAEAFLGSRGRGNVSEHLRNVLSALLYQTGTQSRHYMLVLATNRPQELDSAVLDRMDVSMYFPVPDKQQRTRLVFRYLQEHVLARCDPEDKHALALASAASPDKAKGTTSSHFGEFQVGGFVASTGSCLGTTPQAIAVASDVTAESIRGIVSATEGFSGRAISKVFLNIQGDVYATEECVLTAALLRRALGRAADRHALRRSGDAFERTSTLSKRSSTPEPAAGVGMGSDVHAHPQPAAAPASPRRQGSQGETAQANRQQ